MKKKHTVPFTIYDYIDYRSLLKDYYDVQKKRNPNFSFRYFANKAGVSASVFKDIIVGRRRLTTTVMKKYAVAMKLTQKESDYFDCIVHFVNSKTNDEKNSYFTKIMQQRGNLMLKFIDTSQYEFYRSWYHSAIREMITLPDFREDYEWIAKRCAPQITAAQASSSIKVMLQLGIIRRANNGRLELADQVISTEYEMESFLLRNFHAAMITLAKDALERFKVDEREISSLTLGVSHKCFDRIKERIRTFKQELINMAVADTTDSETVCQCNFQLFPLVKNYSLDKKDQLL